MKKREIEPIAVIHNDFHDKFGIPRQSGRVEDSVSTIIFEKQYKDSTYIREIDGFDYLWLIFDFSEAHQEKYPPTVRPPRLGGNKRVGVFASRSPFRPNSLGLSSVRLIEVRHTQENGTVLIVGGADLLNGTPIYDIKPYLPFSDSHPEAKSGYAQVGIEHRLRVSFDCPTDSLTEKQVKILTDILKEDPRPSYQTDEKRTYRMNYGNKTIRFTVNGDCLYVKQIEETMS